MRLELDMDTMDGYRTFLKVKSLPVYKFTGREAWFPDEYAGLVTGENVAAGCAGYDPSPWLFDYQRDISRVAIRKRKYAVFADCGLGKTAIMLEFARHAAEAVRTTHDKRVKGPAAVLIVSPLMVIDQTIAEARRFYGDSLPVEKVPARDLAAWLATGKGRVGITNYESLNKSVEPGRLAALIADESSTMKSHYGRWGGELIRLGKGIDWKLCLTGTPAPNDRIEYANHAVFIDRFPTVNAFLAKFFVNRGETGERWELKPHALRPFYRALSDWCIFLSRPSVYGWKDNTAPLPPVRVHVSDVPLTAGQESAAAALSGGMFGGKSGGIATRGRLARISKSADGRKPGFVADMVRSESTPCIVWCKYNPEQDELARLLPEAGDVSGDTPDAERVRLIGEFQRGERATLISKPKIMGFGLNLQAARRMVFSTCQDSYEEYYQAVKRANRYGSTHPLDVYIPVTELERPMLENVLRKAARVQRDTEEQERLFKEVGHVGF